MKQLPTFDKMIILIILCPVIPILVFLLSWWGAYIVTRNDTVIGVSSILGLIIGITVVLLCYKKLLKIGYSLPTYVLIIIYLFYSAMIFGSFMGVPVFNPTVGILAAVYVARREYLSGSSFIEEKKLALFSSFIIVFICICSASIALYDKYTIANLTGMFNLRFEITYQMLVVFIVIGGIGLSAAQYLLSYCAYRFMKKNFF